MINKVKNHAIFKVLGKAIILASIQSILASIELSTKIAMVSISKDQITLQKCADSLTSYIVMAIFWTIGTTFLLYSSNGFLGFWLGLISNFVIVSWNIYTYLSSFKKASVKYNLEYPQLFDLI